MAELIALAGALGLYQTMNSKESFTNYPDAKKEVYEKPTNHYESNRQASQKYISPHRSSQNTIVNVESQKVTHEDLHGGEQNFKGSQFVSLSGDTIQQSDFRHNNMAPYFGSKVRGNTIDDNTSESILDNKVGSGSQSYNKEAVAPLFKPEESVQWAHGVPSMTDFIQSRQVTSLQQNNTNRGRKKEKHRD